MNQDKIIFSVLIICYNHEKYIEDAIKSVLAQTYRNIEIVICDDFSTDNSWEIIHAYMPELLKEFGRVVAFRNTKNLGLTMSLNKMILETNGTIIYALSGDDMISENYVTDIVNAYIEHPEVAVFVTNGLWVEEEVKYSEFDISSLDPFYTERPDFCKDTLFERLYWQNCIFAPGASLRKEIFAQFGLYDTNICIEDLEYWLRISLTKEIGFLYIDKTDVFYRKNPNSASSTVKNEHFLERFLLYLDANEKIIDKYGPYVKRDEYIKRKWAFLLEELTFYKRNIPQNERKILKEKIGPFIKKNWIMLGWKQLTMYYHIYILSLLKI